MLSQTCFFFSTRTYHGIPRFNVVDKIINIIYCDVVGDGKPIFLPATKDFN